MSLHLYTSSILDIFSLKVDCNLRNLQYRKTFSCLMKRNFPDLPECQNNNSRAHNGQCHWHLSLISAFVRQRHISFAHILEMRQYCCVYIDAHVCNKRPFNYIQARRTTKDLIYALRPIFYLQYSGIN